ncbi:MAG TPA: hypothetical protein VFT95_04835 [Micromonosporaceae bacterium]|nr:hypothetical protein [Micromonosporaceae bacterium]
MAAKVTDSMIRKNLDLLIRGLHEEEGWERERRAPENLSEKTPEENIVIAACLVKARRTNPHEWPGCRFSLMKQQNRVVSLALD